ncbi:MAG: hypothetical protein EHM18_12460 [Acidobacteria bacterium]|nr:MAG: hypothetical protein EHM18_12460 [Acidobacteriota bacterium]
MKRLATDLLVFSVAGGISLGQRYDAQSQVWIYEGPDIPRYFVVSAFFQSIKSGGDVVGVPAENILADLGIEPSAAAVRVLTSAAGQAQALLAEINEVNPADHDPGEFERIQTEFTRKKVSGLKRLFQQFVADLETEGVSRNKLEFYLDTEIRPGLAISVSRLNGPGMHAIREFETENDSKRN